MAEEITNPRAARFAASQGQPKISADWQPLDRPAQILAAEPSINDSHRAGLWDLYHSAQNETELAQHLAEMPIPDRLKNQLVAAKTALKSKLDRTAEAIRRIRTIDPKVLEIAEAHPAVLKHFTESIKE